MAIKKSTYTGGNGRPQLPSPYVSKVPAVAIIEHSFKEAVGSDDVLELAYLPAFCRILDATLHAVGTGAVEATVGIMSGEVGSTDASRTSGSELFDGLVPTTQRDATLADVLKVESADVNRSIGVTFSGNVAANTATKLYLRLTYAQIDR